MESTLYFLIVIGFLAGLMDAAVGGGGLLQIPGLFNVLPPQTPVATVLGVGKVASFSGTLTATWQYVRKIPVPWKMLLPAAVLAFAASYLGAQSVAYFPTEYMKPVMLAIMLAMFVYTFFKKDLGQMARTAALTRRETLWGLFFGALIGFYDGIFGPGTGSLLAFVFVRFYGYDFLTANAAGKVINTTTNFAALTFFVPHGHVVWAWAVPLALANLCGGILGARLAIRGGTVFLRYGFMLLLCVIIGKFAWDLWQG
ncbi:sulfite exporter TauE/SafE family protein [Neisseria perflava]|uniref:sulfite exporter TauE/SafE family protein n=1 Tax=Neisseria perflava TaxID=33053 RepID=UPI00209FE3AD|nr:sulfite exporter TauE/SafE family protein [Neisseria perflava]MCP1659436.1 putative membrane protein YfcA [Neisseria perflava]MCP1772276.1 putative membrane protein YfcA [Neisseria perflava]